MVTIVMFLVGGCDPHIGNHWPLFQEGIVELKAVRCPFIFPFLADQTVATNSVQQWQLAGYGAWTNAPLVSSSGWALLDWNHQFTNFSSILNY